MPSFLEPLSRQFRPASAFANLAFRLFDDAFSSSAGEVSGRERKKLIEEVLPIALFVRAFDIPGRRVNAKYLGDPTDEADAIMKMAGRLVEHGFHASLSFIEATVAEDASEYLRREVLRSGEPVFTGGIERVGSRHNASSRIENRPVARDRAVVPVETAEWVRAAVTKKLENSYPQPCYLVVRVEPEFRLTLREWASVVEAIPHPGSKFAGIYLVQLRNGIVLEAV